MCWEHSGIIHKLLNKHALRQVLRDVYAGKNHLSSSKGQLQWFWGKRCLLSFLPPPLCSHNSFQMIKLNLNSCWLNSSVSGSERGPHLPSALPVILTKSSLSSSWDWATSERKKKKDKKKIINFNLPWMKPSSSILLTGLSRVPFHALGRRFSLISKLFTLSLSKNCFLTQILARNAPPWLFQPFESILSRIWWTIQTVGEPSLLGLQRQSPSTIYFECPKDQHVY